MMSLCPLPFYGCLAFIVTAFTAIASIILITVILFRVLFVDITTGSCDSVRVMGLEMLGTLVRR
jgi:hypothetical protein